MAYIGSTPVVGDFKKLDDISSQFNDSNTIFNLTVAGDATIAGSAQNLIISIDGVLQEPGVAYLVFGSSLQFTEAPNASSTFFGVQLGSVNQIGTPSDGTVTESKIADGAVTELKIASGSVTNLKLSDNSVTQTNITNNAVTELKIANNAVTELKIANNAVTELKIADSSITTAKIAENAVVSIDIAPNVILRGTTIFSGASIERANVIASNVTSTVTIDNQNNGVVYYTVNSNSSVNVTVNFINMDSIATGNVASYVLMISNNATAKAYVGNVNINGASGNVVKWLGGVPTEGDEHLNIYSFSVVKTAASGYTTIASKNSFQ